MDKVIVLYHFIGIGEGKRAQAPCRRYSLKYTNPYSQRIKVNN